jgi:hypothetical protein
VKQFDVYRGMRKASRRQWSNFTPKVVVILYILVFPNAQCLIFVSADERAMVAVLGRKNGRKKGPAPCAAGHEDVDRLCKTR